MLSLQLNSITVPLFPGTSLQRLYENRLFDHTEQEVDFTIPIEIPLSDEVRRALGFVDNLASASGTMSAAATLVIDGVFMIQFTAIVLNISTAKKTVRISLMGSYGTFGSFAGNMRVNELQLGGLRTIATQNSSYETIVDTSTFKVNYKGTSLAAHMNWCRYQSNLDYCWPTQADFALSFDEWTGQSNYSQPACDYFNLTADADGSDYIDATRQMLRVYTTAWDVGRLAVGVYGKQYFSSPQFYLHYVLRACFVELGFAVSGDILNDTAFQKIYLSNNFAIDQCRVSSSYSTAPGQQGGLKTTYTVDSVATTINPGSHVPDMTISDFVRHVARAFNLQYDISFSKKTVSILSAVEILNAAPTWNIDASAESGFEIVTEKTDYQRGYLLKFAMNDERGDLTSTNEAFMDAVLATGYVDFDKYADMTANQPTVPTYGFVRSTNTWYSWSEGAWQTVSLNLFPYKTAQDAQNLQTIETQCAPGKSEEIRLAYLRDNGQICTRMVTLPTTKTGVYGVDLLRFGNRAFVNTLNSFGDDAYIWSAYLVTEKIPPLRIMNFLGWRWGDGVISGYQVGRAVGSATPYTGWGVKASDAYGLSWGRNDHGFLFNDDTDFLFAVFWERWVKRLKAGKVVDVNVIMDIMTYLKHDIATVQVEFNQQHWLVRSAEINMPFPEMCKLSLVRI